MEIRTVKGRLFLLLLLILVLPLLQQQFKVIDSGKLNGDVRGTSNIAFSLKGWWDGSYQKQKTDYINDSIGFRQDIVRVNNQLDFWLFKKLHANGIVLGTNGYLYEASYIHAYCGTAYPGDSVARNALMKLKLLQDTFSRLGKQLILAYAPSKARFFPDHFPPAMQCSGDNPTVFKDFLRLGDSIGIKKIDFNSWFVSMRSKSIHPLFTKGGTHWSVYGSLLAEDSLIKYIEKAGGYRLPHIKIDKIEYSNKPRSADNDIEQGLNLIYPISKEKLSYPIFNFVSDTGTTKPKIIFIGDSFLWLFVYNGFMSNISSNWEFWYYFREAWNEKSINGQSQVYDMADYDWPKSLKSADCIVLLYTEPNLVSLSSTIDSLYNRIITR